MTDRPHPETAPQRAVARWLDSASADIRKAAVTTDDASLANDLRNLTAKLASCRRRANRLLEHAESKRQRQLGLL